MGPPATITPKLPSVHCPTVPEANVVGPMTVPLVESKLPTKFQLASPGGLNNGSVAAPVPPLACFNGTVSPKPVASSVA